MTVVGSVSGIFRYPVKSMLGEGLNAAALDRHGIPGDRAWGVRDEARGDFFVGKRCADLMSCRARYPDPDVLSDAPVIQLPDGTRFRADKDDASTRLTRAIGRDVTLWPVVPEARQAEAREEGDPAKDMQEMMAREPGEALPDFSQVPEELITYMSSGGPYFDAFPLLLLTQSSIDSISKAAPESQIDLRRFRPSLLIDSDQPGDFPEQDWIGKRIAVGDAVLKVQMACVRCVMTTHGFADVEKDPRVMRTLVKQAGGDLGVYATVEEPGEIRSDDSLRLLD